jgi:hypothetical protein
MAGLVWNRLCIVIFFDRSSSKLAVLPSPMLEAIVIQVLFWTSCIPSNMVCLPIRCTDCVATLLPAWQGKQHHGLARLALGILRNSCDVATVALHKNNTVRVMQ